jgi:hypothetical protein
MLPDPNRSRVVIGTYPDYLQAQRAVDYLSDQKFPVERTAIIGENLRIVEQITGRLNWTRALSLGMGQGAVTGLFIGIIFSVIGIGRDRGLLVLLIDGLLLGIIIGAVWGLLSYALSGGRRDFTSVGGMRAEHYSVMADSEVAEQAQSLLSQMR